MSDDLHLTGKALRTHNGYLRAVRQLAEFAKIQPDQVTETQVRRFFLQLKNERHYAYGSLRAALSGVKFFYSVTCKRNWDIFSMLKLQNINALPEVLTSQQVHAIIDATTTLRMRTFFWTVYSLGIRLNEGLNLQVGDIDAARGLVHIHRGKGAKDRYVPIPTATLHMLREYLAGLSHSKANIPIRKAFAAIMRCRTGQLGGVQWQCDGCGRTHWTGRSCGNRHCSTCGSEKSNVNWASSACCIRGVETRWLIIRTFTTWFPVAWWWIRRASRPSGNTQCKNSTG